MLFRMFGIGAAKAFAGGRTEGTVTKVDTCYWLKVNTKPVRKHMADGAVFPHIIHFTYCVAGKAYCGKRWVHWSKRCPVKGEKIPVHYEEEQPGKYAVML